jgi:hypothetical protein
VLTLACRRDAELAESREHAVVEPAQEVVAEQAFDAVAIRQRVYVDALVRELEAECGEPCDGRR